MIFVKICAVVGAFEVIDIRIRVEDWVERYLKGRNTCETSHDKCAERPNVCRKAVLLLRDHLAVSLRQP